VHYQVSAPIAAPVQQVWSVLTDVERTPEWSTSMTSVQRLDDGPFGVGSRVRIEQPRLPAAVWEVTELTPERSFTWATSRAGVTTSASHVLEPTDNGTRATLVLDQAGLLAGVVGLLLGSLTRRYVDTELAGLTARSEASR
jgi:uncharacterized protein YndB with AHSA1/START domain